MIRTVLMLPRLVSSLWSLQSTFSNVVKVIHTVVSMLKALADLYALVIAPAKMHSVVGLLFCAVPSLHGILKVDL